MNESIASAPPEVWNRKNLPTEVEGTQSSEKTAEIIRQLPSVAVAVARRNRNTILFSLALLGTLGLAWYLSRKD